MLQGIEVETLETCQVEILDVKGRGLQDHLKLVVVLEPVGIFAVAAVGGATRRLHIGGPPRFGPQGAQQGGGVEGAGADLHVVGLLNDAALVGPITAQFQNDILKVHTRLVSCF